MVNEVFSVINPLTHDGSQPLCSLREPSSRVTQSLDEVTCVECLRHLVRALLDRGTEDVMRERSAAVREAAIEHLAIEDPVALTADDLRCPVHRIPDCSPILNGCSIPSVMARRINAVVERTRAADAFKAPEPHAYAVEVMCNAGLRSERWRLDDEMDETLPTREDAEVWLEEQHEAGFAREHLRIVALTVMPQ